MQVPADYAEPTRPLTFAYGKGKGSGSVTAFVSSEREQTDEIRRLKRELARVTEERDILKKATAFFAKESP